MFILVYLINTNKLLTFIQILYHNSNKTNCLQITFSHQIKLLTEFYLTYKFWTFKFINFLTPTSTEKIFHKPLPLNAPKNISKFVYRTLRDPCAIPNFWRLYRSMTKLALFVWNSRLRARRFSLIFRDPHSSHEAVSSLNNHRTFTGIGASWRALIATWGKNNIENIVITRDAQYFTSRIGIRAIAKCYYENCSLH